LMDSKAHETALEKMIGDWTAVRTKDDAVESLLALGVPAGQVQGIDDVAENPFSWEREILVTLQHPESGPVKLLGSPFKSNRSKGVVGAPAPTIGQHTRQVLGELLGYSNDQIDNLAANKVIAVSTS
jgi:crotonobetainyl-CoA:carnitine CoA-transferase CaiB-like acyl-CoA transferase